METVGGALVVTIGGVVFEPISNKPPAFFAEPAQEKKVQEWVVANTRHPVFLAEVLSVAGRKDVDTACFWFFETEAAKFAIVIGYTPILSAARLLSETWLEVATAGAAVWIARVPSGSNPADAPYPAFQEIVRELSFCRPEY